MKKCTLILALLLTLFTGLTKGQTQVFPLCIVSDEPYTGCNFVINTNMTLKPSYDGDFENPFWKGFIGGWGSYGTTNIKTIPLNYFPGNPTLNSPIAGTNSAFMIARPTSHEGALGTTQELIRNRRYGLSFFRCVTAVDLASLNNSFDIYLMRCSDAPAYMNGSVSPFTTPPPDAQKIYCEPITDTSGWRQRFVEFIPTNDGYNMIWIAPRHTGTIASTGFYSGFSYPEMIDITALNMGSNPAAATPPNCMVTIGSPTANCTVVNATFNWVGPMGQIVPAPAPPASQQISINTSLSQNVGLWTLQMTVPGTTNLPCPNIRPKLSRGILVTACDSSHISFKKGIDLTTSANESIKAYPNPAKDVITLELPSASGKTEIFLYNAQGVVVHKATSVRIKTTLAVSGIPAGNYYIKTISEKGKVDFKNITILR